MIWIALSEKDAANAALKKRLWAAADQFCANSGLKAQEYSAPVLGLIFLRFAEVRFAAHRAQLEMPSASVRRGSWGKRTCRLSRQTKAPHPKCENHAIHKGVSKGVSPEWHLIKA